jgi:hypothetical protein
MLNVLLHSRLVCLKEPVDWLLQTRTQIWVRVSDSILGTMLYSKLVPGPGMRIYVFMYMLNQLVNQVQCGQCMIRSGLEAGPANHPIRGTIFIWPTQYRQAMYKLHATLNDVHHGGANSHAVVLTMNELIPTVDMHMHILQHERRPLVSWAHADCPRLGTVCMCFPNALHTICSRPDLVLDQLPRLIDSGRRAGLE